MANLTYADIIECETKYKVLADLSGRMNGLDKSKVMTTLVELLDDEFIPLLAEKWSVTGYDGSFLAENDQSKRSLIKAAIELHRYKGTPWSIREVLRRLGFGEIDIDEGLKTRIYEHKFVQTIPLSDKWAYYAIRLNQPITNDQAQQLRKILRNFAPARCTLAVLDYKSVPLRYNNKASYNGSYNHGSN
ncbi:phage tail protein [Haemophilus influenzae]|uniref:phage tail protein n=1 Tax=Haemophilus influenzae TaxID=727 RepID=UPI000DD43F24|nr:phage tail protein [Haemophilus influenzae]